MSLMFVYHTLTLLKTEWSHCHCL